MLVLKDIYWERVNLHLVFNNDLSNLNITFAQENKIINLNSIGNEIVINVTNTPDGEMLIPGSWQIIVSEKDKIKFKTGKEYLEYTEKNRQNNIFDSYFEVDDELLSKIDEKSKVFPYRGRKCVYLVDFYMTKNNEFFVYTNFMIENRNWKKFISYNEGENAKKKLIIFLRKRYLNFIKIYYWLCRAFKFNRKKNVLFLTENSNVLIDNLKELSNYFEPTKYNAKKRIFSYDIYSPENRKIIKRIMIYFKEINMIAKADIIFLDNYTPKLTHFQLSKRTKLIQLWHAGVGFKSVGYARFGLEGSPHPVRSCHRAYTDCVVDQEKLIDVYKEVYGNKTVNFKALGMPRLDGYLDKERIDSSISELESINAAFKDKKIILFSPTFRGNGSNDAYYNFDLLDLKRIYDFCRENNFIFVFKMHPFIKNKVNIPESYLEYIVDYSSLDINKLIYISDIMITDYSSCAYEFSLFNRPLVFYRFDKYLYEYLRPIHTVDSFTDKQIETTTFDELMDALNELKDIKKEERFKNVSAVTNNNTCEKIINEYVNEYRKR